MSAEIYNAKKCPGCGTQSSAAKKFCPKCNHQFYGTKKSIIFRENTSVNNVYNSNGSHRLEAIVREQSNTTGHSHKESDHDKMVLQKAMLPGWFYLGRHQFTDHNDKPVGAASYNAYNPHYNNGMPISYSEFHMLVAAIVRIVDTGNPEGKVKGKKTPPPIS